jgi:hypothetical protein
MIESQAQNDFEYDICFQRILEKLKREKAGKGNLIVMIESRCGPFHQQ